MDPTPPDPSPAEPRWLTIFISLAPSLTAVTVSALLIGRFDFRAAQLESAQNLRGLLVLVTLLLLGIGSGFAVRELLRGAASRVPREPISPSDRHRDRLARYVLAAGTIGIGTTAVTLIAVTAQSADDADARQLAFSVFSSVLPVFATWVGTVLAFYFTNESFRQAAKASYGNVHSDALDPITRAGTMVPFERVVRLELTAEMIGTQDRFTAAEALPLDTITRLFQPPGIVRVVIFDDKKIPLFVIHHGGIPPEVAAPVPGEAPAPRTLKTYLDSGNNRTDAINFTWTSSRASIADGRRLIMLRRVTDLFVTQNGRSDEATIGWVPDENLREG